jgi:hypothetical protein
MKSPIRSVLAIVALCAAMSASAACGKGAVKAPHLPDLKVTADKDVRAAISYTYVQSKALADELDASSTLYVHAQQISPGAIPASADTLIRKAYTDAATRLKQFVIDVDAHGITDWAQVQARFNPIIDDFNDIVDAGQASSSHFWADLLSFSIGIFMQALQSGAFQIG